MPSSLGGVLTSDPTVIANSDGHLEAFVRGSDNALWHIAQTAPDAGWSDWTSLGGVLANAIASGLNLDGRVTVFVAGSDQSLWFLDQAAPGLWN